MCRQRFVSKGGVCTPCENSKNELETTVKQRTVTETLASTTYEKGEVTGNGITGIPTTEAGMLYC